MNSNSGKITKSEIFFVFNAFIFWRVFLFILLFISIKVLPLQHILIGGGLENYVRAPWFWAWANFDGEHYLAIAQSGYGNGEQPFFPLYPFLIRIVGGFFGGSLVNYNWAGLLISNISFLVAMLGFYKLIRLDFPEKIAKLATVLLLTFPTSFYFGSVYTESLFFMLSIWAVYFVRVKKWLTAGLLAGVSSATRFSGILFTPFLFLEYFEKKSLKLNLLKIIALFLVPTGLIVYMIFLKFKFNDPLAFIHNISLFGGQRSETVVLFPQVFYRYIFKVIPNLDYSYFPAAFTTLLEFGVALVFITLAVWSVKKLKIVYLKIKIQV